nr:sulfated surface glycoprotein 185-like [Aegilops tauschii subsp. strangulata]
MEDAPALRDDWQMAQGRKRPRQPSLQRAPAPTPAATPAPASTNLGAGRSGPPTTTSHGLPPSSAVGRSREVRWLESSPSSAGSPPTSYRQALCRTAASSPPVSPLALSPPPSLTDPSPPPARPSIQSEIYRPMEDAPALRDDWQMAQGRKRPRQRPPPPPPPPPASRPW